MAKTDTVSSVIENDLMRRIQALRLDPDSGILSMSAVVRQALVRGVAQLEYERSIGHGIHLAPLRFESVPVSITEDPHLPDDPARGA